MAHGDFLRIDFTGTITATGEVFDTTMHHATQEAHSHHAKPALVVLGAKMVLPTVEKQLEGMSVGEEKTFTVPPEEGFGERKADLIKVVSLAKFHEKNISARYRTYRKFLCHVIACTAKKRPHS